METSARACSPRHLEAALALARTQEKVKLTGCPRSPAGLEGTTAAPNRCSSCRAGGGGNLGVHFKGTRAPLGLKRSLPGACACKGDFCYQTLLWRGRENSCVSV